MNTFEQPTLCGCNKPDCYFCWLRNRVYTTTALKNHIYTIKIETPEEVFHTVCRLVGADPEIVKSQSRNENIVIVRQIYCYVAKIATKASFKKIGNVIGRTHCTAIHSFKTVKDRIDVNYAPTIHLYNRVKILLCS